MSCEYSEYSEYSEYNVYLSSERYLLYEIKNRKLSMFEEYKKCNKEDIPAEPKYGSLYKLYS
jgi:hypothetical protein